MEIIDVIKYSFFCKVFYPFGSYTQHLCYFDIVLSILSVGDPSYLRMTAVGGRFCHSERSEESV